MCRKKSLTLRRFCTARPARGSGSRTGEKGDVMMKLFARSVVFLTLLVAVLAHAQEAPDALVKKTVDEVLAVIKDTRDQKKLLQVAEAKVVPYFDFKKMTQLAAGRAWSQASAAQQDAL